MIGRYLLILTFIVVMQNAAALRPQGKCDFNPAERWARWVTNATDITYWDNSDQIAHEKHLPKKEQHPYRQETHISLDKSIENAPEGWHFVMIDFGNWTQCPEKCDTALFSLTPNSNCSTTLTSYLPYDNKVTHLVECIYKHEKDTSKCRFDYHDLHTDGFIYPYNYGYNSTAGEVVFYGEGAHEMDIGGYLVVQETISNTYVAPLELVYNHKGGKLETPFSTPLVYKRVEI